MIWTYLLTDGQINVRTRNNNNDNINNKLLHKVFGKPSPSKSPMKNQSTSTAMMFSINPCLWRKQNAITDSSFQLSKYAVNKYWAVFTQNTFFFHLHIN